ncbi:uncharacterized protein RJT20DRAFT_117010 [Scheffersomyces xylosifermentans]|uniref:uncharacterized protein n=1 Tax=Scheffersomyces xylosifermentans TaxID=1304137 RepID=UPI00315DB813
MSEEPVYKRMQIKVLYSFNNNSTVFLSRSKNQYSVKTAQIPMMSNIATESGEQEMITLGAFDLKGCVQQIIKSSPENFKLHSEDYAVYYKDITEQPEEPFVANGELSALIASSKTHLIPGRVCQNLSASFLFGDKSSASPLTLEIRLKLHTIEGQASQMSQKPQIQQNQSQVEQKKRMNESHTNTYPQKRPAPQQHSMTSASSVGSAVKATRTKSLPIFNNIPNQTMFNIMNADKLNQTSRYDSKSVQDRFKSAPFLSAKIIDKPVRKHRRNMELPQRAMRTRSMVNQTPIMMSSPINEEPMSDSTDDTEYRENQEILDEEEEDEGDFDEPSPYTPQQPPYKNQESNSSSTSNSEQFQSLPDLEDLDSKRTHTIPHTKLPKGHGLICVNSNCATVSSITWRYFETEFRPNYFAIHRAKEFDKKHYDGMFGPLCNACYLFLRNKGFMRPENVVKKYLQQQRYKRELKNREEYTEIVSGGHSMNMEAPKERSGSLSAIAIRKSSQYASSPVVSSSNRFPTPSHTPSAINQVIQNSSNKNHQGNDGHNNNNKTPNYGDLNDFMNQLNDFGGPLTDIDPLPQDQQGVTPPMMATKSNTRVINLYDDGEDKENCPPSDIHIPTKESLQEFESMIAKSFTTGSEKSSPVNNEWINAIFTQPTPNDQITPLDSKTPLDQEKEESSSHPNMPILKTFTNPNNKLNNKKAMVINMPSSPLLTSHQASDDLGSYLGSDSKNDNYEKLEKEIDDLVANNGNMFDQASSSPKRASRTDTTNSTMSWNNKDTNRSHSNSGNGVDQGSTPSTDFYSNDDVLPSHGKGRNNINISEMYHEEHS